MTDPTATDVIEPEKADAYALMRMHIAGDEDGISALLDLVGAYPIAAMMTQIAVELGAELHGGEQELDERLAHWLANRDGDDD